MYVYKVQHACVLCVSMSKQIYIVLVRVWNIQPKFWSFMDIIILVREYNYQLRLQSQTGLKIH